MTYSKYSPKKISDSPWIVILDNFLSKDECNKLIHIPEKWDSSTTIKNNVKSVNPGRTSFSFFCNEQICLDNKIIKRVNKRINKITTIDKNNYEGIQLTKYNKGGFYKQHHDYIIEKDNPEEFLRTGPRILTVLLYLSDVTGGGGTSFVNLGHTINPKAGRALIWTNVHNNFSKDERTQHEALEVISGTKFISQIWIHSKKYK